MITKDILKSRWAFSPLCYQSESAKCTLPNCERQIYHQWLFLLQLTSVAIKDGCKNAKSGCHSRASRRLPINESLLSKQSLLQFKFDASLEQNLLKISAVFLSLIQYKNLSNYAKDHVRLLFSSILNSKICFSAEANQTHYILLLFMV